jgi:hypothetical protein
MSNLRSAATPRKTEELKRPPEFASPIDNPGNVKTPKKGEVLLHSPAILGENRSEHHQED